MNLISTSWSCWRCGAAFTGTPPEHGLCDDCRTAPDGPAPSLPPGFAVPALEPCLACGGPVCADCGQALILLGTARLPAPAREVNGDGG
jgi:hypothetical protein